MRGLDLLLKLPICLGWSSIQVECYSSVSQPFWLQVRVDEKKFSYCPGQKNFH